MRSAATTATPRISISWIAALYLFAGGIVAATHHYWAHLHSLKGWGSALLANRAVAPAPPWREPAHSLRRPPRPGERGGHRFPRAHAPGGVNLERVIRSMNA